MNKTLQCILGTVLILGTLPAQGAKRSLIHNVLGRTFSDFQVSMTSDQGAILQRGESSWPVELEAITEFDHGSNRFLAMVVVFNELQEGLSARFRRGEHVDLPTQRNQLILARLVDPLLLGNVPIDTHALGTARHEITVKDFVGDGTTQLVLTSESVYPLVQPRETIIAHRMYLYTIPDLRPIVAGTSKRVAVGEKGVSSIEESDMDFMVGESGKRVLRIRNRKDGTTRLIERSVNGGYDAGDQPWTGQEEKEQGKTSKLSIRVVDQDGSPIPGATISGFTKKINPLNWSDKNKPFKASTDKRGEFEIASDDGVGLTINATGYYPVEHFWNPADIPAQPIVITLDKAHPPVQMIGCTRTRKVWEEEAPLSLGVRFIDGEKGKWKDVPVNDPETADLWIEVLKSDDAKNWREWTVQLSGKKGWEMSPGAMQDDTSNGNTMREAPIEGYKKQLEYRVGECPQGLYLRFQDGRRYGKVWGFRFEDRSRDSLIRRYIWIRFAVQAQESGSRSLNPL